ncbi:helix-turn-helix domain-containing protein [Dyella agri]|uniref:Helix-turn-helix transcriptional regulator n=1 Tax=Dyella agri TaxID=1926869 RepID=A0ABW8KJT8_9GAMM
MTELRIDKTSYGMTSPMGSDDAYLVCLNFRMQTAHELWCDGRSVCSMAYEAGTTYLLDLRRDPFAYIGDPLHSLYFYMPRRAIGEVSEDLGGSSVGDIALQPGECIEDSIIMSIGQALLPILRNPSTFHQPLVDHLLQGLCAYLASNFGGPSTASSMVKGTLAPWQQRLVTQMMRERLFEGISVAELAEACGLSAGALVRGFKKSTGVPPHQWLLSRRVDLALELMADPDASLADVAFDAGFSDQSHFSRVFTQKMGVTPGLWRKSLAFGRKVEAA